MDVEDPKRLAGTAAAAFMALPPPLILAPPPVLTLHGPILATLVPGGQNTILAESVHVRLMQYDSHMLYGWALYVAHDVATATARVLLSP